MGKNTIKGLFKLVSDVLKPKGPGWDFEITSLAGNEGKFLRLDDNGKCLAASVNPDDYSYKGEINVNSDFPTISAVSAGDWYSIGTNVTDDDVTKTNTGLSFIAGDEIYWDGSTWQDYGALTVPISGYDATIGTGGDYPSTGISNDIQTAITAGKLRLKLISDITLQQDINIDNGVIIDLNGYTITCDNYHFTRSSGNLNIKDGELIYAHSSNKSLFDKGVGFDTSTLIVRDVNITNNSTSQASVATSGYFENIILTVNNDYPNSGFGNNVSMFLGVLKNVTFIGGSTGTQYVAYTDEEAIVDGIKIQGTFGTIAATFNNIINFIHDSTDTIVILVDKLINAIKVNSGDLIISGCDYAVNSEIDAISGSTNGKFTNCKINNSEFTPLSGANTNMYFNNCQFTTSLEITSLNAFRVFTSFINCRFDNNLTFTKFADNCKINNCSVSGNFSVEDDTNSLKITNINILGNLIIDGDYRIITNNNIEGSTTLSLGSEKNIIAENYFDGGFTNNSGETNNIIKNNIT